MGMSPGGRPLKRLDDRLPRHLRSREVQATCSAYHGARDGLDLVARARDGSSRTRRQGSPGSPQGMTTMLTIRGGASRFCDGVTRREFLKIGGLALGGLALTDVLAAEAQA